jgi:hypothetical protein
VKRHRRRLSRSDDLIDSLAVPVRFILEQELGQL